MRHPVFVFLHPAVRLYFCDFICVCGGNVAVLDCRESISFCVEDVDADVLRITCQLVNRLLKCFARGGSRRVVPHAKTRVARLGFLRVDLFPLLSLYLDVCGSLLELGCCGWSSPRRVIPFAAYFSFIACKRFRVCSAFNLSALVGDFSCGILCVLYISGSNIIVVSSHLIRVETATVELRIASEKLETRTSVQGIKVDPVRFVINISFKAVVPRVPSAFIRRVRAHLGFHLGSDGGSLLWCLHTVWRLFHVIEEVTVFFRHAVTSALVGRCHRAHAVAQFREINLGCRRVGVKGFCAFVFSFRQTLFNLLLANSVSLGELGPQTSKRSLRSLARVHTATISDPLRVQLTIRLDNVVLLVVGKRLLQRLKHFLFVGGQLYVAW